MTKEIIKQMLAKCGYKLMPLHWQPPGQPASTLYKYVGSDGNFDYEKYRATQERGNVSKLDRVWVEEDNIRFLSEYIRAKTGSPRFGICHGTRRGKEQEWFRKYLGIEVIGTEISSTATQFPHTIQWDFHDVKPEWKGAVNFIYSNSFDHSYDPEKCLNSWMSCLAPGGVCLLEHTSGHEPLDANELDPFGAHLEVMPYLVTLWGKGRFAVTEILSAPVNRSSVSFCKYLVIRNI